VKIGITRTDNPEKHLLYLSWLQSGEDLDIITLKEGESAPEQINPCEGIVLSGGWDIHPAFYGNEQLDYPGAPPEFRRERDLFEFSVYQHATERGLPVLGICRGLQLINTALGGSLVQDLTGKEGDHVGNPDKLHEVGVTPGTLLHEIVQRDRGQVNSAHHQAIERLGAGLKVNCQAGDGTIEGIERKDPGQGPFLLAVQWHPERMFRFHLEDSAFSKAIRDRFIQEILKVSHQDGDH
jgi:putative glutamine amidotransferase